MEKVDLDSRFQVLGYEQVVRLNEVLEGKLPVHGRGNFPTLELKLKDLVKILREKLENEGIIIRDVRLNGGAACYILGTEKMNYKDLDLIFGVELSNHNELQKIKNCVLECLIDFLPDGVNKEKMNSCSLKEAYVQKMVKVCNEHGDRWSLISLMNNKGRNIELKFVDKMKRQFEFSVDSFQIILDSLLTFYNVSETAMSEHFYPTIFAESLYGDFCEAWFHLIKKKIATRCPEEIRGGGLLKYCHLLVRKYTSADDVDVRTMERYMCSRFFIDFGDILQQSQKLSAYLESHFIGEEELKYEYLTTLYKVVDESTICLMNHERRQTLNLIHQLAYQVYMEEEQRAKAKAKCIELHKIDHLSNLVIDQVFYGPFNPELPPGSQIINSYTKYNMPSVYQGPPSPPCPFCPQCPPQYIQQCS
ncbi:hypothetical protein LOTGIDRAFT_189873 [Lottia gigantea]|uniref:polynucleotide adenylyltransferase n=1 Tax=Lottia gigantea TaxID=225164 RepID=V4ADP2_LOTGI|nr:hypothetical protein LOTGIDRAFT_189873 [Lottia gigantea]ESO93245.1 hypothetical protein LOTGIDRAFT_189873 [Lottia gigantea]